MGDRDATQAETGFGRRRFLFLGSATLLAPLLPSFAWAQERNPVQPQTGVRTPMPMSVGYLEGSDGIHSLLRLPANVLYPYYPRGQADNSPRLLPSTEIDSDTDLIGRPLRLRIQGLYPNSLATQPRLRTKLPSAIDLDVLFPQPEPGSKQARMLAWSFRKQPWNLSAPVAFNYPLDWHSLPAFQMALTPAQGRGILFSTLFTFDQEAGRPRLRRGLYLLGAAPQAWETDSTLAQLAQNLPPERLSILLSVERAAEPV